MTAQGEQLENKVNRANSRNTEYLLKKYQPSYTAVSLFCSFLKEHIFFFVVPVFLLFFELFMLHISGVALKNTAYITAVILTVYTVFFVSAGIRFVLRSCRFFAVLEQAEQQLVYAQDGTDWVSADCAFTDMQYAVLRKIQSMKNENTALKADTRSRIREQNDYFSLWIHQIKTPIASLFLLLQNRTNNADTYFQMQKALLNIDNYTQMALHYLKLHGTERDLYFSLVSIDSVLQSILRKYRSFFIYNNILLQYEPSHQKITSEAVFLEVMIEQIISNSLKYCSENSRQGCITIYTATDFQKKDGTIGKPLSIPLALIIEDNGIGIDAADLPKIFDKGYSGHNGKLAEKATGLGLYLAKAIAERINCSLEITSEYGTGTRAVIGFYDL